MAGCGLRKLHVKKHELQRRASQAMKLPPGEEDCGETGRVRVSILHKSAVNGKRARTFHHDQDAKGYRQQMVLVPLTLLIVHTSS